MNSYASSATQAVLVPADPQAAPIVTLSEWWDQHSPYDRRVLNTGIVHFGPGRFFRGHLAQIIHQYLAQKGLQDQRWGICGVSLKSRHTITRLQPQDYLYTLVERYQGAEHHESADVIGSINQILDGMEEHDRVLDLMGSPDVHLVTLTITQAGYCLDARFNLDTAHAAIVHDRKNPTTPTTVIGFIVEALRRRRDRGIAPFTILSCDNLPRNGEILQKAVLTYTYLIDPELAVYIKDHATFPNTVVDRIVPQAHDSDEEYPYRLLQVHDRTPIITEPFWQFVVEDQFKGDRPAWEETGVIMTDDITPYLYIKSRLLNAMHSFIACLAVRAGIEYVHEAIKLPEVRWFAHLLMDDIAAATPVPDQMCESYKEEVLQRFSNEALPDTIERISAETARKTGKYIVPILQNAYSQNVDLKRLILPIAAWMLSIREGSESGNSCPVKDQPSVVSAIRAGASLSQSIGLKPCDCTEMLDRECDAALRDLELYGLFTTLSHHLGEEPYAIISAA